MAGGGFGSRPDESTVESFAAFCRRRPALPRIDIAAEIVNFIQFERLMERF
jgi:hypothetical protein